MKITSTLIFCIENTNIIIVYLLNREHKLNILFLMRYKTYNKYKITGFADEI